MDNTNYQIKVDSEFENLYKYPQCNTGSVTVGGEEISVKSYCNGILRLEGAACVPSDTLEESILKTKALIENLKNNPWFVIRKFPKIYLGEDEKWYLYFRAATNSQRALDK